MIKFTFEATDGDGSTSIRTFDAVSLGTVLEETLMFLRGMGFQFEVGDELEVVANSATDLPIESGRGKI